MHIFGLALINSLYPKILNANQRIPNSEMNMKFLIRWDLRYQQQIIYNKSSNRHTQKFRDHETKTDDTGDEKFTLGDPCVFCSTFIFCVTMVDFFHMQGG